MGMSAHTPGPWRCAGGMDMGYAVVEDATHTQITGVLDINANARLIAAAPDLLAAAERGVAALSANGAPNCEAAKELRRAIARAVGEPRTVARLEER